MSQIPRSAELLECELLKLGAITEKEAKPGDVRHWATGTFQKEKDGTWSRVPGHASPSVKSTQPAADKPPALKKPAPVAPPKPAPPKPVEPKKVEPKAVAPATPPKPKSPPMSPKDFVSKLTGPARNFFASKPYRDEMLKGAAASLKAGAAKVVRHVAKTVKHEVAEYKTAGLAIKKLANREKLDKHEKHALATAVTHTALLVASASLAGSAAAGLAGAKIAASAAAATKGVATRLAARAAGSVMEKFHVGGEIAHIAHLFADAPKDAEIDAAWTEVTKMVTDEMAKQLNAGFTDEDLQAAAQHGAEALAVGETDQAAESLQRLIRSF